MEREIIDSELIQSFGYDFQCGTLEIEFRKGGAVWNYYDVPELVWHEFYSSGSRGRYFLSNIKGSYREVRIS